MKMESLKINHAIIGSLIAASVISTGSAQAADTNARDFYSAPVGTQLGVLYLPNTKAKQYNSDTGTFKDAELDVQALAYRHIWFSDICGTLCTPQIILSGARVETTLPGATTSMKDTGLGDIQLGGTLFLIKNPEKREYSGLLSLLTVPVGSYDADAADTSAGANRWGATFLLNYTRGISDKWTLEGSLEAQLYGDNDDYYGQKLAQDPLYRLQAFASYDFTPSTYGAFRLYHAQGGALEINGSDIANSRQEYTQIGFEIGHWFDNKNQLMLSYAENIDSQNTFDSREVMLRLAHVY